MTITGGFSNLSSYNFRVVVTDSLGNTATKEAFSSTTENVLIDLRAGGKGLGIGRLAQSDSLEVGLPTIFYGNVKIRVGSSDVTLADYIRGVMNGTYT